MHHDIGQSTDYSGARPVSLRTGIDQALPGVFIDQVQHPHGASIVCLSADEVVTPHMVPSALRSEPSRMTHH